MKILILNWRSIKDPLAGGAESVTLESAKRWVKKHNAQVTWLSSPYDKDIQEETIEGIKFLYVGVPLKINNTFLMLFQFPYFYFLTIFKYLKSYRGKVDVIIDQSHGFPFMTPLYSKEKTILYIHEYAEIIWDKMFIFPINIIGKTIEKYILRLYKNNLTITGTEGTKKDLVRIGLKSKNIQIIKYGINLKPVKSPLKKYSNFTILFLNRIVKMKGPERAISIFVKLKKIIPETKMIFVGRGDKNYIKSLEKYAKEKNVFEDINFKGFVSEAEKLEILQKSHVLINTSFKEGWGLVNIEANSQGTPAVAFNVEGCRESIQNGVNGFVVNNEDEFVEKIIYLKKNNLEESAINYSKQFNYDDKAEEFWEVINDK